MSECPSRHPEKRWALCGLAAPHPDEDHRLHHGLDTLTWPQERAGLEAPWAHEPTPIALALDGDPVVDAQRALEALTAALGRLDVRDPTGTHTLLDVFGQSLVMVRESVRHYGLLADAQDAAAGSRPLRPGDDLGNGFTFAGATAADSNGPLSIDARLERDGVVRFTIPRRTP